jgi:hypothetical protein
MPSFFKAVSNEGKRMTVVVRPITVDPDCAVDVEPDVAVQLAEVVPEELLPEEWPLLAVGLLVGLPLHAAARSATAAITPSAGSRRKLKDIKKRIPIPSWPAALGPHTVCQHENICSANAPELAISLPQPAEMWLTVDTSDQWPTVSLWTRRG